MPSTIIIMAFEEADKAQQVYESLEKLDKDHTIDLDDAVVVVKDEKGKIHAQTQRKRSTKTGALAGGTLGFLLGLGLGGPIGAALLGAVGGGLIANVGGWFAKHGLRVGFSQDKIDQVSETLQAGNSAILVQLKSGNLDMITAGVRQSGGKVLEFEVTDEMAAGIEDSWSKAIERDR